jgi:acetolactate synthase-1/3 small subunit
VECIDSTLPHVLERLGRLACVRGITAYTAETHFGRELVMVTVGGDGVAAAEAARIAGAHVIDSSCGMLTLEWAGPPEQAEALIDALKPYGISNVARSGIITLERPAGEGTK